MPSPGFAGVKQVAAVNGREGETMDELDNILNDEPTQTVEVVEAPQVEEQPRQPDGKFAPKGETVSASPAPVEEPTLEHPALIGERRRRQEAEARIAELERKFAEAQNPPTPPPSVFEDEDSWKQHLTGEVVSQAVQTSTHQTKLQTSEFYARKNIEGFEQSWPDMNKWLQDNPSIANQAVQEFDPWGFAWQQYQNNKLVTELGAISVPDLEAKIEARVREKLQAEAAQKVTTPTLPNSLADSQSARATAGAVFQPPTLEDILGR